MEHESSYLLPTPEQPLNKAISRQPEHFPGWIPAVQLSNRLAALRTPLAWPRWGLITVPGENSISTTCWHYCRMCWNEDAAVNRRSADNSSPLRDLERSPMGSSRDPQSDADHPAGWESAMNDSDFERTGNGQGRRSHPSLGQSRGCTCQWVTVTADRLSSTSWRSRRSASIWPADDYSATEMLTAEGRESSEFPGDANH